MNDESPVAIYISRNSIQVLNQDEKGNLNARSTLVEIQYKS